MEYQIRRREHGYGKWFLIDDDPDSTPNGFPNNRMEREFVMTPISGILKGVKIVCIKLSMAHVRRNYVPYLFRYFEFRGPRFIFFKCLLVLLRICGFPCAENSKRDKGLRNIL